MWKTILRRVLLMIPQLFVLSLLIFILAKLMPGDALSGMIDPTVDAETIEKIRLQLGYYDPWYIQYFRWVKNAFHGDLGISYTYKLPVLTVIGARAMNSFSLSILALTIMYCIALPVGIFAGKNQGSKFDKGVILFNFFTYAIPSFVMYLFAILLFGYKLKWFPTIGSVDAGLVKGTFAYYMSRLHHMIKTAICIDILSKKGTIKY